MNDDGLGTEIAIVIGLVIGIAIGLGSGYFAFSTPTDGSEQYNLNTSTEPSNGGSIKVSPEKEAYDKGTKVSLEAVPESGYVFDHWTGDYPSEKKDNGTIQLEINSDKEITAHFTEGTALTYEQLLQDYQITGGQGTFSSYDIGQTIDVQVTIENMGIIKENEVPQQIVDNLEKFGFSFPLTLIKSEYDPSKNLPQLLLFNSDLSAKYDKGDTANLEVHVVGREDAEILIEWIPALSPQLGTVLTLIAFG